MDYSYDYGSTYDYGSSGADAGGAMAGLLAGGIGIGMMILWLVIVLVIMAFWLFIAYKIIKKMGYSGWMILLVMFFQPIMLIYFAFAKWPVEQKVEELTGGKK
jgi:4-hydroxybenzoate polyprenyltransferase